MKTASNKCWINMVTWSFLPFDVSVILNLSIDSSIPAIRLDCSQSPIFLWDFRDSNASIELPPSLFVRASATWGECLNYRVGPSQVTPVPLGILDTLPRLRSLLQTKMTAVQSKLASPENPTEKWGTVNSLPFA